MEQEQQIVSCILITIVCIVVGRVAIRAMNWLWLKPKKMERSLRQQGLTGTSYKFLVGDLKDFTSMRAKAMEKPMNGFSNDYLQRVEPLHVQLMSNFGKDYFTWHGPLPVLHLSKPELFKQALAKIQDFHKLKLNAISDKLFPGFASFEGERWAKHRRIINPAFHVEKLKLLLPAFSDSCTELINKWDEIVAETGSSEVDVWPYVTTLTADVISRAAFGSSYKEGQMIFELLKEQIRMAHDMRQSVYIPGLRYIPTARNRRFVEVENQMQTLLKGIVNKRKEAMDTGEAAKDDLLGILMESNLKEIQAAGAAGNNNKNHKLGMSLQDVINECKLFYIGGQETTSILLVWTLMLLSKHQDWQAKAREEVVQTFGKDVPSFEGLNRLTIVNLILYEVLRLYPPATHLGRKVNKDTKLGELTLPAGTMVNFQMLFIHRDKDTWGDDADEFKPERFSEGISKATRGNNAFFPFGWGPRICIAEKFVMLEVKMVLSLILQRFSFRLSPSYSHAPVALLFSVQPQLGAQIILRRL